MLKDFLYGFRKVSRDFSFWRRGEFWCLSYPRYSLPELTPVNKSWCCYTVDYDGEYFSWNLTSGEIVYSKA
jgi:hypothetical protein